MRIPFLQETVPLYYPISTSVFLAPSSFSFTFQILFPQTLIQRAIHHLLIPDKILLNEYIVPYRYIYISVLYTDPWLLAYRHLLLGHVSNATSAARNRDPLPVVPATSNWTRLSPCPVGSAGFFERVWRASNTLSNPLYPWSIIRIVILAEIVGYFWIIRLGCWRDLDNMQKVASQFLGTILWKLHFQRVSNNDPSLNLGFRSWTIVTCQPIFEESETDFLHLFAKIFILWRNPSKIWFQWEFVFRLQQFILR